MAWEEQCGRQTKLLMAMLHIGEHFRRSDRGSGTILGVMLMMVAGVALSVVVAAGNVLVCQSEAQSTADMAAISSANALWKGETNICAIAERVARSHAGSLQSCSIKGEDVTVTVTIATSVPFVKQVTKSSRAGPVDCQ